EAIDRKSRPICQLACFALRRSVLAVNSQFPQIVGLSRADFRISRIDESSRREPRERAQMIVLKDSRFIRTTEVTTLNHNLCVVTTFITSICCDLGGADKTTILQDNH